MNNLNEKTILVTGGTGFIGTALCETLAGLGARIIVLSRKPRVSGKNISFVKSLSEISEKNIDVVINLAGEPIAQCWTQETKNKIQKSRTDTTALIVDFIKAAPKKPALFISGSAIGYYGTDPHLEFNEFSSPASGAPFSRALCAAWEAEAVKAQEYGVRTVLLRIGAVLGKGGGMLAKLLSPFRLGLGGPIGSGEQWLSWIDRDDLVKLIVHIMNVPSLEGPVNATAPNPVKNAVFSKSLAAQLRRPALLRTPAFALRAVFADMADEIMLQGQKVLPTKALASGFVFSSPDLDTSLKKILETKNGRK